jgi:glutamate racemase
MHILITDSGVGGLSVVAYAERFVRTEGFRAPVRLTFANAAPANDYGYNSMPTHAAKIETFDRFLRNVTERYAPDMIYVACNTLSVLLPEVTIAAKGIIETGVRRLLDSLDSRSIAVIFATQTTTDAGVYPRLLRERGVDAARIVSQACPGLADVISEDRSGLNAEAEIRRWVGEAMAKLPRRDAPVVACLACTHYGYRKEMFAAALGSEAIVINPNESAVGDLFERGGESHDVDVRFITRYALPRPWRRFRGCCARSRRRRSPRCRTSSTCRTCSRAGSRTPAPGIRTRSPPSAR